MDLDSAYRLYIAFIIIPATAYIFYSAATGNKWAIMIVCICLAISYGDRVWNIRGDSFFYNFIKGIQDK
jgi:hypothetical protein